MEAHVRQTNTYQKPPEDFAQGARAIEVALSVGKHQIFLNPGTTDLTSILLLSGEGNAEPGASGSADTREHQHS